MTYWFDPAPNPFKRRNPLCAWLLSIVTLGIYGLVWYYSINRELAEANPRAKISPAGSLLAITLGGLLVVPPFVSIYNTGDRIGRARRGAGLPNSTSGGLGLLLALLFGLHVVYYQSHLNAIHDEIEDRDARMAGR